MTKILPQETKFRKQFLRKAAGKKKTNWIASSKVTDRTMSTLSTCTVSMKRAEYLKIKYSVYQKKKLGHSQVVKAGKMNQMR